MIQGLRQEARCREKRKSREVAGGPDNRASLTPEGAPFKLRLGGVFLS